MGSLKGGEENYEYTKKTKKIQKIQKTKELLAINCLIRSYPSLNEALE